MRDPARIPRILAKLEKLWEQYPDQRLGQLLENFVYGRVNLFYPEDDKAEGQLDAKLYDLMMKDVEKDLGK